MTDWQRPDVPGAGIELLVVADGRSPVLRVRGEIDEPDARAIHDSAVPLLGRGVHLVIDLSAVEFMGSFGVNTLVRLAKTAVRSESDVTVATGPGNRAVRRPIELSGIGAMVRVVDDVHPPAAERTDPPGG